MGEDLEASSLSFVVVCFWTVDSGSRKNLFVLVERFVRQDLDASQIVIRRTFNKWHWACWNWSPTPPPTVSMFSFCFGFDRCASQPVNVHTRREFLPSVNQWEKFYKSEMIGEMQTQLEDVRTVRWTALGNILLFEQSVKWLRCWTIDGTHNGGGGRILEERLSGVWEWPASRVLSHHITGLKQDFVPATCRWGI